MKCIVGALVVGLSCVLMAGSADSQQAASPDVQKVVEGNNAFALDLYSQLAKEDGNLFFSPYSISTALAMTYAGARGETASEMATTLQFGLGQETLHPAFAHLRHGINGKGEPRGYELVTANRLWGQNGYPYVPEFLKLTEDNYGAGLKEVDFIKATEEARKTINGWVEEQTKDKIKELLKPGILKIETRLVLTNAIYFKAAWMEPFIVSATKTGPFKVAVGPNVAVMDVPMMSARMRSTSLYQDKDLQVAMLPYVKNDLSMVVILPNTNDGLPAIEKLLKSNPGVLSEWLTKSTPRPLEVTMPKFKTTIESKLNDQLKALGMKAAFDPKTADFSALSSRALIDMLHISAVVHKAFVDVNEAGSEAAAATAVILGGKSRVAFTPFRADHPFLYLIRDNRTGSILFMGRMVNPKQ